jgi:DNA-binding MurR/RpiR family transcriptional regulator
VANRIVLTSAPGSIDGLRQAMQTHYDELSPRLKQVAELLMREPQAVATGASRELAAELGVPQSTLTRFAKVLGYATFKELQALFRTQYVDRPRDYLQRVQRARSAEPDALGHGPIHLDIAHAAQHSLQMTALEVSEARLQEAAALLRHAGEIWVHGVRRAHPVAVYLHYMLLKVGARASLLDLGGGLLEPSLCRFHARGVLLVVTYSPHADETELVIDAAHRAGVPMIAFSDPLPSAHAKDMAVRFEIREGEVMGFRSLCASMYLAQALVVEMAQEMIETPPKRVPDLPRAAKRGVS